MSSRVHRRPQSPDGASCQTRGPAPRRALPVDTNRRTTSKSYCCSSNSFQTGSSNTGPSLHRARRQTLLRGKSLTSGTTPSHRKRRRVAMRIRSFSLRILPRASLKRAQFPSGNSRAQYETGIPRCASNSRRGARAQRDSSLESLRKKSRSGLGCASPCPRAGKTFS